MRVMSQSCPTGTLETAAHGVQARDRDAGDEPVCPSGTLDTAAFGVQARAAILLDQLGPANTVSVEILFRRAPTTEYSWLERIADREAWASGGAMMSLEGQALLGGLALGLTSNGRGH